MDVRAIAATAATATQTEPPRATRAEAAFVLAPQPQPPQQPPDPEQVARAAAEINRVMAAHSRDIEFTPDPSTGHTVIKVVDLQTHDVIVQIPSQEVLDISRALDKLQGLILRQKA